ncbi:hypothetical protein B0H14DRAFT_3760425 [Mycena olivaceomarginata]|nr:hypothetical protein B0H14DRAFT_3760425 [Mycena olivaceomarginata]
MLLCRATSLLDLGDAALVPTFLVLAFCAVKFHPPFPLAIRRLVHATKAPFKEFLTLREAEGLLVTGSQDVVVRDVARYNVPVWRPLLVVIGLAQSVTWISIAACPLVIEAPLWQALSKLLSSTTWMYTVVRAATHVTATPPYDLFVLYLVYFVTGRRALGLCVRIQRHRRSTPGPRRALGTVCKHRGAAAPPASSAAHAICWVYPLIKKGTMTTLADKDVFELSSNIQSRPVFIKFSSLHVEFVLTVVSVFFNYVGPFFLKRILDAIDTENATPRDRGTAYVYAVLMLLCAVLKAQCDLQHLWHGRRASTRIRVELIAAVYDKALKRKDFSGLVDRDKAREAAERKAESQSTSPKATQTKAQKQAQKAKAEKADDPKAGADTGKIVNLMAGDQTRVSTIVSGAYNIYGAPIEIVVGSAFLYELLGWSAVAGFVVLLVGWPLNSYVARRRVRMHKGELKARDGRMSVVNELIGSVKFIKFFAWEERWIKRALDAREVEMKWMIKSSVYERLLMSFTYVMLGNHHRDGVHVDCSVRYDSLAAERHLVPKRTVIPSWVVRFLQTRISLNRIAVYLEEDEVSAQVSSLKKDNSIPLLDGAKDEGLWLENASLRCDQLAEEQEEAGEAREHSPTASIDGSTARGYDSGSEGGGSGNNTFELRDILVLFPVGKLSVITGPTVSAVTLAAPPVYPGQHPVGYPYNEAPYREVIECCALQPDLYVLEDGDATEIGACGVNLSGGQKASQISLYTQDHFCLFSFPRDGADSGTASLIALCDTGVSTYYSGVELGAEAERAPGKTSAELHALNLFASVFPSIRSAAVVLMLGDARFWFRFSALKPSIDMIS